MALLRRRQEIGDPWAEWLVASETPPPAARNQYLREYGLGVALRVIVRSDGEFSVFGGPEEVARESTIKGAVTAAAQCARASCRADSAAQRVWLVRFDKAGVAQPQLLDVRRAAQRAELREPEKVG